MNSTRLFFIGMGLLLIAGLLWWYFSNENQTNLLGRETKKGVLEFVAPETVMVKDSFDLEVSIDTMGNNVNATGLYLRFDPQKLQLLNMQTKDSYCQLYPEKKFDNNVGTVSLACGTPHPGFKGENKFVTLEFMPLTTGQTVIRMDPESQLLLSDGKGTNILTEYPSHTLDVVQSF